jgi:hypothetical protein
LQCLESDFVFYNYVLCNPLKPGKFKIPTLDIILPCEPFYVGKGKGKRKDKHLWEVTKNINNEKFFVKNNKHRKNTIRKILSGGLEPVVFVLNENSPDEQVCKNEIYLIKVIGRRDLGTGCLTNLTDGGETTKGFKMPREIVERIAAMKRGKPSGRKGFLHSQETKDKVSKTKKEQYAMGMVKARAKLGRKADNALAIIVYNPFENIFSEFDSIRNYLGIEWSKDNSWRFIKIQTCCRGGMAQYKRLIFIYKKDFTPEYLEERLKRFRSLPKGKNKPYRKDEYKKAA